MTTAVPSPTFGPTGFVAPSEASILAGAQADVQAAFGGNLNPALNTPQGQLASSLTAIIGDCNDQFLALANGVDPAYAAGRMQDAIGRIYFIARNPAQATVVTATCVGLVGAVIPVGAKAADQAGVIYLCTAAVTIPVGGSISTTFVCSVTGPTACPIGYLSTIYQAIPGWDSVLNAGAGVIGNRVENRADFEYRRSQSVALNAQGSAPSVLAVVLKVSGVLDAYVTENVSSASVTVGGVILAPHSLYVAAYGGAAQDIGNAIWTKKSPGCDYNGSTSVTVTDSASGYSFPYPSYMVTFQTPTPTAILFAVSLQNNSLVPSNYVALVRAALLAAFVGADGGARARIGSSILASRFYGSVAALGAWAHLISLQIGIGTANQNAVLMQINQIPTLSGTDIAVTLV